MQEHGCLPRSNVRHFSTAIKSLKVKDKVPRLHQSLLIRWKIVYSERGKSSHAQKSRSSYQGVYNESDFKAGTFCASRFENLRRRLLGNTHRNCTRFNIDVSAKSYNMK